MSQSLDLLREGAYLLVSGKLEFEEVLFLVFDDELQSLDCSFQLLHVFTLFWRADARTSSPVFHARDLAVSLIFVNLELLLHLLKFDEQIVVLAGQLYCGLIEQCFILSVVFVV